MNWYMIQQTGDYGTEAEIIAKMYFKEPVVRVELCDKKFRHISICPFEVISII